jgi:hypothetical protein
MEPSSIRLLTIEVNNRAGNKRKYTKLSTGAQMRSLSAVNRHSKYPLRISKKSGNNKVM